MEIERHHECLHTLEPEGFQQEKGEFFEILDWKLTGFRCKTTLGSVLGSLSISIALIENKIKINKKYHSMN